MANLRLCKFKRMTVFIGSMYSLVCMTAFERYIASLLKSIQWHEEDLKF